MSDEHWTDNKWTVAKYTAVLRRMADALDKAGIAEYKLFPEAMLEGEAAIGAAAFLCFLRDLLTTGPRESYPREDLLVLLELLSNDQELFPGGAGRIIWQMEE